MLKKENRLLFYISSLTWGLLMTIIGLFVFLFMVVFMKKKILKIKVIAGRLCISANLSSLGGISLGLFYMVGRSEYKDVFIHAHELGHSIQNAYLGPLFLPIIGIPSIIRAALWRKISSRHYEKYGWPADYYSIWFEKNANILGGKYLIDEIKKDIYNGGK